MNNQKEKVEHGREIRVAILTNWPEAFCDGYAWGIGLTLPIPRDAGGFPIGYHTWPADKKRAWDWGLKDALHLMKGLRHG
jgi:hypothetical protein